MILTGVTACDNVEWGGVELSLQAASERGLERASVENDEASVSSILDADPALYIVDRSEGEPRLVPIAFLGADGLHPFRAPAGVADFTRRFATERMSPGRRFVLFSNGARVGSFYPRDVSPEPVVALEGPATPTGGGPPPSATPAPGFGFGNGAGPWCAPRPAVTGWIELRPDVPPAGPLLALPAGLASERAHGDLVASVSDRDQRTGALNLASALFQSEGIVWPPDIVEARADLQVFRPAGAPEDLIASTFLYGDALATGPAPPNGYSLFFIGEPADGGRYLPTYVRYREVGADGKAAARFVTHADWDGDGRQDVLLEVFGESGRWFEALARDGDGWTETYSEGCPASDGRP